jgi:DHA2 family multidrug resistance protein
VVAPFVVILLLKIDLRLLISVGFALAAAACLMFAKINPQWSDADFFNPLILQTVGQPFVVVGLVASILILVVSKGALKKPWEVATLSSFFQTVRLIGAGITSALLRHFITVQNKFHAMVLTDNLQSGDWRTTEQFKSFANHAASLGGTLEEMTAQTSRLGSVFIREQVLTLTIADGFRFVGEVMVICMVLIALMRYMPLALPAGEH